MDRRFDFLVIGGGVIGLSIARELHRSGARKITIIEKGEVGREASWAAAGMLSPNIETNVGTDLHRLCRESLELYPSFAEQLSDETGVGIELNTSGTFEVAFDEEERLSLQRNFHALREVGVVVENVSLKELSELEPQVSSKINGANFYPRDWQVENRQLLAALRRFADLNAIEIIENKPVTGIGVENGKVTGAACNEINFFAEKTIIAAGAWTSLIKFGNQPPPFRIKPIRGQMIWFDCRERLIEKVIYGPRCYLVPRADGRILAGSTTEDVGFENFVTESAIEYLRNSASEILPALSEYEIAGSWSGLRPRSDDGLPILGNVAGYENMFVATGHYRNGILLAPMTAKIVAQKAVDGIDSEYFSIFSRDRFAIEIRSSGA